VATEIGNLPKQILHGQNQELLAWLRQRVHQHGRMLTSEELCKKISGKGLQIEFFLQYLLAKYRNIYQF